MSSPSSDSQQEQIPHSDMQPLNRLAGAWKVQGGVEGTVTYEWMEGGYFLIQHVDLMSSGRPVKGIEIIGHLQPWGESSSADIRTRYYGSDGSTFDYVYEMEGDTLTIWGGEKGSPAYMKGSFSEDGNTFASEWVYPGGGGYTSIMTRIK